VLVICFLKAKSYYSFEAYPIVEGVIKLMGDSKERIKMLALETLAVYASIGNKFSVKEIVY
jgi:hypothetical protein